MHRSSLLSAVRVWALVALLVGLLVAPAHTGLAQTPSGQADTNQADTNQADSNQTDSYQADINQNDSYPAQHVDAEPGPVPAAAPEAPAVVNAQQIVALSGLGYVQVYGLAGATVTQLWQSQAGGWGNIALDDYDGDGYKEIVATTLHTSGQNDTIAIFDPRTSTVPIVSAQLPNPNFAFNLLAAGNFWNTSSDQVVYSYNYTDGTGFHEYVMEWAQRQNQWVSTYIGDFGAVLKAMTAGDVNRDGLADLLVVRNVDRLLKMWAGQNGVWSNLNQSSGYASDWYALAVGKVFNDSRYPGNDIVLTRKFPYVTNFHTELMFWWNGTNNPPLDLTPATTPSPYSHYPAFTRVALGNLNGNPSGFKQILGLRDPQQGGSPYLVVVDPVGFNLPPFAPAGDYGAYAWEQIAAGDIDADGKDEIAIVRPGNGSAMRIYDQPDVNTHALPDTYTYGGFMPPTMVDGANALAIGDLGLGGGLTLGISPSSLAFGSAYCGQSPAAQQIHLTNAGGTGNPVPWQASVNSTLYPWIHLSKTSGQTPDTIYVTIDVSQGQNGANTGTIHITSDPSVLNPSPDVSVTFTRVAPVLAASPSAINLTVPWGQTGSAPVQLSNTGSGAALAWTANPGTNSWIHVSPVSGNTPGAFSVTANASEVGIGTRTGTVTVTGKDACNVSQQKNVSVSVTVPDPGFTATPPVLALHASINPPTPVSGKITVAHPGSNQVVTWEAFVVSVQSLASLQAALADGSAQVTDAGIRVGSELLATPTWLTLSPLTGNTRDNPEVTVTVNPADPTVKAHNRVAVVFVPTNPFNPDWVRTVQVDVHVGEILNLPFVVR